MLYTIMFLYTAYRPANIGAYAVPKGAREWAVEIGDYGAAGVGRLELGG